MVKLHTIKHENLFCLPKCVNLKKKIFNYNV